MDSVLSILEANKENMTAQVYFSLKQELEKKTYYEITYTFPRFEPCRDGYNLLEMSLRKAIVPNLENISFYINEIQRDGFTQIPGRLLKNLIETTHFVYDTDQDTRMVCDDELEEQATVYPWVQIEMQSVCVTNIKKLTFGV
jgi:hypothetical protein